jgi:hypothetical protein
MKQSVVITSSSSLDSSVVTSSSDMLCDAHLAPAREWVIRLAGGQCDCQAHTGTERTDLPAQVCLSSCFCSAGPERYAAGKSECVRRRAPEWQSPLYAQRGVQEDAGRQAREAGEDRERQGGDGQTDQRGTDRPERESGRDRPERDRQQQPVVCGPAGTITRWVQAPASRRRLVSFWQHDASLSASACRPVSCPTLPSCPPLLRLSSTPLSVCTLVCLHACISAAPATVVLAQSQRSSWAPAMAMQAEQ